MLKPDNSNDFAIDRPSPKRRFWQIHLSTAVILTMVASLFLGINLDWRRLRTGVHYLDTGERVIGHTECQGWPFAAHTALIVQGQTDFDSVDLVGIIADFICGAAIVIAVAFPCEHLARRRSRAPDL